jgi:hypothetical protein
MITPITDEQARRIRRGRPRDAGKQHRHGDIHMPQPSGHPAGQHAGKINQLLRDQPRIHQVRRQQKERHGKQDERVIRLEHPVDDDEGRQPDIQHHNRDSRDPQGKGDRHPQRHQQDETAHKNKTGKAR